jgi:hypothetical protein
MLINLDLQFFADDVDDDDTVSDGEAELFSAIRDLAKEDSESPSFEELEDEFYEGEDDEEEYEDDEDDEESDDEEASDDDIEDEDDGLDEEEDDDEEEDEEPQGQSKEDNAKFAARRRQQELEARVQEQLKNSPEYKLAQKLAKQFGKPIDQIMTELDDADIQQEAEQRQVTPEQVRRERERDERAERLEQENNQLRFENWQTQIQLDTNKLIEEYPMLTQEDFDKSVDYILNVAKNVELPLEDAVFAVHGKKIAKAMAKQTVQDDLANQSGRKRKTPLAPNNTKSSQSKALSADEQYIARQFGMTDDEYRKFQG